MSEPRAARHGRVEQARQKLVNAEEAFLRAHGWERFCIGGTWLWCASVPWGASVANVIMHREDAVKFQHDADRGALEETERGPG